MTTSTIDIPTAERQLLGSMLLLILAQQVTMKHVVSTLRSECFSHPAHRTIYRVLTDYINGDRRITAPSVKGAIDEIGELIGDINLSGVSFTKGQRRYSDLLLDDPAYPIDAADTACEIANAANERFAAPTGASEGA